MPHLAALFALLGLFSLFAANYRPARRAPRGEAEEEEAAIDTAARVLGLALIGLASLLVWP